MPCPFHFDPPMPLGFDNIQISDEAKIPTHEVCRRGNHAEDMNEDLIACNQ